MTDTVPNRVDNFGSTSPVEEQEAGLTVETLDSHTEKLPHPTGYRILILPFSMMINSVSLPISSNTL